MLNLQSTRPKRVLVVEEVEGIIPLELEILFNLKLKIKILKLVVVQEEVMLIAHRVVKLVELTGMMKIVPPSNPSTRRKKTKYNKILNKFNI